MSVVLLLDGYSLLPRKVLRRAHLVLGYLVVEVVLQVLSTHVELIWWVSLAGVARHLSCRCLRTLPSWLRLWRLLCVMLLAIIRPMWIYFLSVTGRLLRCKSVLWARSHQASRKLSSTGLPGLSSQRVFLALRSWEQLLLGRRWSTVLASFKLLQLIHTAAYVVVLVRRLSRIIIVTHVLRWLSPSDTSVQLMSASWTTGHYPTVRRCFSCKFGCTRFGSVLTIGTCIVLWLFVAVLRRLNLYVGVRGGESLLHLFDHL